MTPHKLTPWHYIIAVVAIVIFLLIGFAPDENPFCGSTQALPWLGCE
jgi:hypothetical protein